MERNRVFGGKCYESLASYQQNEKSQLWSWKMSQLSLLEEDARSLDRLPKSGIVQSGQLFPLEALEPLICEKDGLQSLILPTPTRDERRTPYAQGGRNLLCALLSTPTEEAQRFGQRARLNPRFVEWMMGFPIGHTDLDL